MPAIAGVNTVAHDWTAAQSRSSMARWIRRGQLATRFPTRGCGYCFEANCRCPISFLVNRRHWASKVRVCARLESAVMRLRGVAPLSVVLSCALSASTQVMPLCPATSAGGMVPSTCAPVERFGGIGAPKQDRPVESSSHDYQIINTAPAAPRLSDPAAPAIDSPSTVQFKAAFASVRPETAVAEQLAGLRHEDDVGSFAPLTPRQKFEIFARHTFSPFTFASAAFDAG